MSIELINIGAGPNDHTGDSLRTGAQKINANFQELSARIDAIGGSGGGGSPISVDDQSGLVAAVVSKLQFLGDVQVVEVSSGVVAITLQKGVFSHAGDPNGVVTATGPAICLDSEGRFTWSKYTSGTSNNEWV